MEEELSSSSQSFESREGLTFDKKRKAERMKEVNSIGMKIRR
jgi:hypothetical protein